MNDPDLRRATIAKAHALKRMLQELANECGPGSPEEFAVLSACEVLAYLDPDDGADDEDEPPQRPRLRIVGG
jgi:hypothetical protein